MIVERLALALPGWKPDRRRLRSLVGRAVRRAGLPISGTGRRSVIVQIIARAAVTAR